MKRFIFFICIFSLAKCETHHDSSMQKNANESSKERPLGINKPAKFIRVQLKVYPYSDDSILVKTIITNTDSLDFTFYKPLLPFENFTEDLFSIIEKNSYNKLRFCGHNHEKHMMYANGPSEFIIPELVNDQLVILKPNQTMEIESNIAHIYEFKNYLNKGLRNFKISYMMSFPFITKERQVSELDSVDGKLKPVYYVVGLPEKDDPDSMRVEFKVPSIKTQ